MLTNFLSSKYPTGGLTDGDYLYRSLGSFWTQIFQDKNVLRGYTRGMAEELIQSYYNLIEVINQYSVKDIPILHKEKWLPLYIKKSAFNKSSFVFEPNAAVFGQQPKDDRFYASQLFRFGYPKETSGENVFSFEPDVKIKKLGCIANRIISPSLLLLPGVDIIISNNTFYFNSNIFNNSYIPKSKVLTDNGEIATYVNAEGKTEEDEFIILWCYHAELDNAELYNNFGILFDLKLNTSEAYKNLLKALVNISIEGPSINALNVAFAALTNTPLIIEKKETVEQLYSDDFFKYVVTDKNVYRISLEQELQEYVKPDKVLFSGDIITSNIRIIDTVINPNWWQKEITSNKIAVASHLFAANTKNQFFFENKKSAIIYKEGKLSFPVLGKESDVEAFHTYINSPENKSRLLKAFEFSESENLQVLYINPIEYVFKNFFKNNTLFLKLEFKTQRELDDFFSLLPILKNYIPAHVYLLVYMQLNITTDQLDSLNLGLRIEGFNTLFSMDGSNPLNGSRPELENDENYYKDYSNRLFCISTSPLKNNGTIESPLNEPLHASGSLDTLNIYNPSLPGQSFVGVSCGLLRTEIPEYVTPPGESEPRKPSTKEVQSILLIDF